MDQRAAVRTLLRRFPIPDHGRRTVLVRTLEHAWTQRGAYLVRLVVRQKVTLLVRKTQIAIFYQPQIMLVMRQFELLQLLLLDLEMPQIRMHQLLLHHLPPLARFIPSALQGRVLLRLPPVPPLLHPEALLLLVAIIDAYDLRLSDQLVIVVVEVYQGVAAVALVEGRLLSLRTLDVLLQGLDADLDLVSGGSEGIAVRHGLRAGSELIWLVMPCSDRGRRQRAALGVREVLEQLRGRVDACFEVLALVVAHHQHLTHLRHIFGLMWLQGYELRIILLVIHSLLLRLV